MSWKSLTCITAFCVLMAAPAMADPSLSLDLKRNGSGNPVLAASGGFQISVGVAPDASLFSTTSEGTGGSVALDVGVDLTGGLSAASATANGTNFDLDIPGDSTFGDETADGDGDFVGVQVGSNPANVFGALGSTFFTDSAVKEAFTIVTNPLSTANLTVSASLGGAFDSAGDLGGGTHGQLAQDGTRFGVQDAFSYTALVGDVNLDGIVNITDLGLLSGSWLATGKFWQNGNLNSQTDSVVNITDLGLLSGNWLATSAAALTLETQSVPEPAAVVLVSLGLVAAYAVRRSQK